MKSAYDIRKIKAVVLYIVEQSGGVLDYITLFKRMYFSQQKSLATYGRPMFQESFRAVKMGLVPPFTYKGLNCALAADERHRSSSQTSHTTRRGAMPLLAQN